MANSNQKFSQLNTASSLNDVDFFIGLKKIGEEGGEPVYDNIKFTPEQLYAYVRNKSKKIIAVEAGDITNDGKSLTDIFFLLPVSEIVTNTQTYIRDVDFTQTGSVITGIGGLTFYPGQKLIAKL